MLHSTDTAIGYINLRIGNTKKIIECIGHIGYYIDKQYRGNRLTSKLV
jgi:predicted acetyltransferase